MFYSKVMSLVYVIHVLLLPSSTSQNFTNNISETMATLLDDIFKGYDRRLPPKFKRAGSDNQVSVVVQLYVNSIFSIREANMDYAMSIFLRERWTDERLTFTDTLNLTRLELDTTMFGDIWMPDLYIINEKESDYHEVTVPNKMVHIYPNGTVQFSARVTGIFSCRMYLHKYPFDSQTCRLDVESYGHSTKNLKLIWDQNAVTVADDILLPNVMIESITSYNCDKNYFGIIYPCIGVTFVFERNYEYFILQIYLPSILIVILSWAIDVYMAACLTFVFLGLVEFAYVNVLTRVEKRRTRTRFPNDKAHETDENSSKEYSDSETSTNLSFRIQCCQQLTNLGRARLVDKISRVMFPLTFIVFNLVYCTFYFWKN